MDPNAGKKNMFNKLSKEQCVALLEKENFKRITVSFYKYIILENLMNSFQKDGHLKWRNHIMLYHLIKVLKDVLLKNW